MFNVIHIYTHEKYTVFGSERTEGGTKFLIFAGGWTWVSANEYIPCR